MAALTVSFFVSMPAAAEPQLADWDDFDELVAQQYGELSESAPCYPPAEIVFGISLPPLSFDSGAFAALTNATAPQTLAGVPAWRLRINEAIDRGDDILLKTDPIKWDGFMREIGKESFYNEVELPRLLQRGVIDNAILGY